MTTPADELRTAAAKLRALATAASTDSGPRWTSKRAFPDQPTSTASVLWADGTKPVIGVSRGRYLHGPISDYIAAMDPTVGLALAALLEGVLSSNQEASPAHEKCTSWCSPDTCDLSAALAVARAINANQP